MRIDDDLAGIRRVGRRTQLTDSEPVCLGVDQTLLGYASESHGLHAARRRLGHLVSYLPKSPGYDKRLCAAPPLVKRTIGEPAMDSYFWFGNSWIVDSTPVPFEVVVIPGLGVDRVVRTAGLGLRLRDPERLAALIAPQDLPRLAAALVRCTL